MRAYAYFKSDGTIEESKGIESILKNGNGDFKIVFDSHFPNFFYFPLVSIIDNSSSLIRPVVDSRGIEEGHHWCRITCRGSEVDISGNLVSNNSLTDPTDGFIFIVF